MKYLILSLSFMMIIACSRSKTPVSPTDDGKAFGIFFVQDSTLTEQQIANTDINTLVLKNKPWLTGSDIEFYDFSTHCIYLNKDKSYFFDNYTEPYIRLFSHMSGKSFVLMAGGERCYVGTFHSAALSTMPLVPYMDEFDIGYYPADIMHISGARAEKEDVRNHPRVKQVLMKKKLYRAGPQIQLTSFKVIENSDTSTVEYTIRITNNDRDNLYVLDPQKMTSEQFHYYAIAPHLWDYSKPGYFYAQYAVVTVPEPYDSWKFEWFTLLQSNQSMERTIRLRGYPRIPNGNYVAYSEFSNPHNIPREKRLFADGRIWIGSVRSNDLQIIVQE